MRTTVIEKVSQSVAAYRGVLPPVEKRIALQKVLLPLRTDLSLHRSLHGCTLLCGCVCVSLCVCVCVCLFVSLFVCVCVLESECDPTP